MTEIYLGNPPEHIKNWILNNTVSHNTVDLTKIRFYMETKIQLPTFDEFKELNPNAPDFISEYCTGEDKIIRGVLHNYDLSNTQDYIGSMNNPELNISNFAFYSCENGNLNTITRLTNGTYEFNMTGQQCSNIKHIITDDDMFKGEYILSNCNDYILPTSAHYDPENAIQSAPTDCDEILRWLSQMMNEHFVKKIYYTKINFEII